MRFCSIASGSSGNCIYVGSDNTHVLVDIGISGKKMETGLNSLELTGRDLDGILITHEHSDHIKGLGVISRKYGIPIYATAGTVDAMVRTNALGKIPEGIFHEIQEDEPFMINDLKVNPFTIPHDAAQPVGYRLEHEGHSVGIATDLGKYNDYIIENLQGLDALLLEANHDIRMLALEHLSRENNYEELAYETVCSEVTLGDNPYKSKDFRIQVAKRDFVSDVVTV